MELLGPTAETMRGLCNLVKMFNFPARCRWQCSVIYHTSWCASLTSRCAASHFHCPSLQVCNNFLFSLKGLDRVLPHLLDNPKDLTVRCMHHLCGWRFAVPGLRNAYPMAGSRHGSLSCVPWACLARCLALPQLPGGAAALHMMRDKLQVRANRQPGH